MRENKNTRSSAATLEREKMEKAAGMASVSDTHYSTDEQKPQAIYDALPVGHDNAITPAALAAFLGVDKRTLRAKIEQERRGGALILSSFDHSGYYRPQSGEAGKAEISRYYYQQRGHALSMLERLAPARRALGIPDGQLDFGEGE